jgi:hypothetical protein
VPSIPMPAALWPSTLLHRHYVFCETDQEAVNKLYVDGDVELWEGTRHVALLTLSNLLFEQWRPFAAASAPPSGRLLRNDQRSGRLSLCVRFPRHVCVFMDRRFSAGGLPVLR